jgi:SAM-dependent methyltransferase
MLDNYLAESQCQFCLITDLEEIIFLGYYPPVNALVELNDWNSNQVYFPLQLNFCPNCFLVQIGKSLDPEIVFPSSYPYLSGMTKSLISNFARQAEVASHLLRLETADLVVDIASNDGSLLVNYQERARVLGVEPTDTANVAISKGIPTIKSYFNQDVVNDILTTEGQAKLVTICNAFAHIPDLNQLIQNIKSLLKSDGVFISENHYLGKLIETLQFDTIYHEHLRYYSVKFLLNAFRQYDLDVFRVEEIDSHGGSIRVWACHKGYFQIEESVGEFIKKEESESVSVKNLRDFSSRMISWRNEFRKIFSEVREEGKTIVGVGAPSRASTLIGFAGLSELDVLAVAELPGSLKLNKYMPGTRIPILTESQCLDLKPDVLLILSWHLGSGLLHSLAQSGFTGRFLIPLPSPRLVDASNYA